MTPTQPYTVTPPATRYSPDEVAAAGFHGKADPALRGTGSPSEDQASPASNPALAETTLTLTEQIAAASPEELAELRALLAPPTEPPTEPPAPSTAPNTGY
jgi:hypothetical protein